MKLFVLEADLNLAVESFNAGVKAAQSQMTDLKSDMVSLGDEADETSKRMDIALGTAIGEFIGKMAGAMTDAVFQFTSDGIVLASSLEEVQNVIDTTFGSESNKIEDWAERAKFAFGMGELSAKQYVGTMGAALSGMNIDDSQLYGMSTALVQLAGDVASFYNLSQDVAFQKIFSGMTGEMEPLKSLGIVMSVANLEAHALAMGLGESWEKMDTATQTQVRYSYLMQQTANAQGDFAKTSDSYTNQLRLMEENINSIKLAMGESLLPVLTELVGWFNSLFGSQEQAAESVSDFGSSLTTSYIDVELTTSKALALVTALEELQSSSEDAAASDMWNAILSELNTVLPGLGGLIDTTTGQITGGTEALRAYVEQWQTSAYELARTSAIQSYYDEYAAMQRELMDYEIETAINQQMIDGMTKNIDASLSALMEGAVIPYMSADYRTEENLAYLRSTEGLQELYDALSSGDMDAIISGTGMSLSSMLDMADMWEQIANAQLLIGEYEKQLENLPTYEAEIETAKAEIQAYEQRLAVLEQIVASQEPPVVNVDVNVTNTADTDVITTKVEKRIMNGIKEKAFAY